MFKKVILSTVIASSAITSVSALDFNDKFYGKANVKIGYNFNSYSPTSKLEDTKHVLVEDNQSHGVNAGAGFDVFFKATNNIHPFAGLEVNGNYMFNGSLFNYIEFNQFFNANFRFGTSFKINKNLSINPYGLVGFNVSRFKPEGVTEYKNNNNIEDKDAALGYVIYNWFVFEGSQYRMPTLMTFNENGDVFPIFNEKVPVYSNNIKYTTYDADGKETGKVLVRDTVDGFADLHYLPGSSKEDFINYVKYRVGEEYMKDLLWTDGKGTYVYYDLSGAEVKDSIVKEWASNAGKYPEMFDGKSFVETGREYISKESKETVNIKSETKIGLNVGAGVDFVIKERFIVGVEYKFSQWKLHSLSVPSHSIALRLGVQFL